MAACSEPIIIAPDAVLPDGSVYAGEISDGKLHGQGKLVYPEGGYYEGEFNAGSFHGQGVFVGTLGDTYEGEFAIGNFQGKGSHIDSFENHYQGDFVNWLYDGVGKLTYKNESVYQGGFKQGLYHGQGKFTQGESVYAGSFVDGVLKGQGTIKDYDGSTYTGEVQSWSAYGDGVKVTAEGETISGNFSGGYAQGKGQISWADGRNYIGNIEYDKADGEGVLNFPNGSVYEGDFSYGNYQGLGTLTTPATNDAPENVITGKWRNGKLAHNFASGDRQHAQAELALENHQRLLQQAEEQLVDQQDKIPEVYFLGVAGDGSQSVFRREIEFVRPLIEGRYGSVGKSISLVNHHDSAEQYPMATRHSIKSAIGAISQKMDKQDDVLFLYLSSHGSKEHEFYLNHDSIKLPPLAATDFAEMLEASKVKWKVIVISACYAGGFIPVLSDDHTLIITAADAKSRSFGCSEEAEMTYFGRALFSQAMTNNPEDSLSEAFGKAKNLVTKWEKEQEKESSSPMMHAPKAIVEKLAGMR